MRGLLEGSSDANADGEGRARVGAGLLYSLHDEFLHRGHALGRRQHLERAHVVAACALYEHRQLETVAGDDIVVDHGWGVVSGVHAGDGAMDHRYPEITFPVAATYALVDGGSDLPVHDLTSCPSSTKKTA